MKYTILVGEANLAQVPLLGFVPVDRDLRDLLNGLWNSQELVLFPR